ncbi:CPBP family intramembrane glutamic endopeptidase [Actinokineospora alba]|uniref:CPBP family intramembrane glutamic endopeptidase n=1 Tax=Actinokineospora alba TaxID=504798 RepID=UPI001E5D1F81|nr:CPBP family intramembrane glutamic endopeptidase [Actinokineospora alba]
MTTVEAPPARDRRSGLLMLAVFAAAQVVWVVSAVLVLVPFSVGDGPLPLPALVALLVVPTALAAVAAVVGTALLGSGPRPGRVPRELAFRWSPRDVGLGVAIGAGGLVVTIPAAAAWSAWVGADEANSAVGEAFDGRTLAPATAVAVFLVVWLLAPLGEEILFRGVLWRALEHWRWNRWVIFAVTSAVFSIAHMELLRTPLLLVISIPVGLARMFTGNLLTSVIAHQTNNFLPALALLLITTGALPVNPGG